MCFSFILFRVIVNLKKEVQRGRSHQWSFHQTSYTDYFFTSLTFSVTHTLMQKKSGLDFATRKPNCMEATGLNILVCRSNSRMFGDESAGMRSKQRFLQPHPPFGGIKLLFQFQKYKKCGICFPSFQLRGRQDEILFEIVNLLFLLWFHRQST